MHPANIQDRDGGVLVLGTLFGRFPFLKKLFADGGYQGPVFDHAQKKILRKLKSSNDPTPRLASRSYPDGGSWREHSPGSEDAAGSPRMRTAPEQPEPSYSGVNSPHAEKAMFKHINFSDGLLRRTRWWRSIWLWLVIVFLLLILAWIAGRPSGTLVYYLMSDIATDPAKAKLADDIFVDAEIAIEAAEDHYRTLSFLAENRGYGATIPPSRGPNTSGIGDFIEEFTVGVATTDAEKPFLVTITFNVLNLLKESYELFGWIDYYVVFKTLNTVSCSEDEAENSEDEAAKCWSARVHYWPLFPRPIKLSGTSQEISRDLAVLLLHGALHDRDAEWRKSAASNGVPPFLMKTATPSTMHTLEAASKGFSILSRGMDHPACRRNAPFECVEAARKHLAEAKVISKDEDKFSAVAAFGLALVEMDAAFRAAHRSDSALTVVSHLREAVSWIQRASPNDFLEKEIKEEMAQNKFAAFLELYGLHPDEDFLRLVRDFSCILVEHWRENWEHCLLMLDDAIEFPQPLAPYLDAARLEAEFSEYPVSKVNALLVAASELRPTVPNGFRRDLALIRQMCMRPEVVDEEQFLGLVKAVTQRAPQGNIAALHELILQSSGCRIAQSFPTEEQMQSAVTYVEKFPHGMERGRLFLALHEYYMRIGDIDSALSHQ